MYGREELKYKMLDKGGYQGETKAYIKEEADSVMNAMETRIKELESIPHTDNTAVIDNLQDRIKELEEENKHLEDYIDVYQKSEAINIAKLDKKDEYIKELRESLIANDNHWLGVYHEDIRLKARIKELEQALTMASDPALHPTCADCEKCQPKWISVNDRLPTSDTTQYLVYDEMTKKYGKSFFSLRFKCFQFDVTHWMPLPPPPTTEEK